MWVDIDIYNFHRYSGEVYSGLQKEAGVRWDMAAGFIGSLGGELDLLASKYEDQRQEDLVAQGVQHLPSVTAAPAAGG